MSLLNLGEKPDFDSKKLVPFALGFRPFFLLAGCSALLLMLLWLGLWHSDFTAGSYYGRIGWHSHEMLLGYSLAVVSGFLLTAVKNWTGAQTPTGLPLALLALVWLAGRLAPWISGLPPALVMLIDLAYIPLLTLALIPPLWKGKSKINRLFVLILLFLFIGNLLIHSAAQGWISSDRIGTNLVLHTLLLLVVMVSGRVMPFFTQNVIPGFTAISRPWVEKGSILMIILISIIGLFQENTPLIGTLYILFGLMQALRLYGWHHPALWKIPVLWVLHTGYLWLILGAILMGLAAFDLFMLSTAKHAFTVGVIGVITLGMMARVARGHTGRPIDVTPALGWAFGLLNLAGVIRVFGPDLLPGQYLAWIMISGTLWLISFGIFTYHYLPILIFPRVDGKPG